MYASQFDGAAAFSGGGFMPTEATQAPDSSFSPAKNRDVQALLPLTVKQISDAFMPGNEKSEFVIDGVDVNNVKLVGIIRDRVGRVSDVTFVLDDGTGRIDCNKWFHEAVDANEMDGILPVEDYNEIASHFIECIYVHFYNSRSRKLQGGVNTQSHETSLTNQSIAQSSAGGSKSTEDMVMEFLHQPMCLAREEGANIDLISNQLRIPKDKIMLAIDNLVKEGAVYSTVDDNHYKSAING